MSFHCSCLGHPRACIKIKPDSAVSGWVQPVDAQGRDGGDHGGLVPGAWRSVSACSRLQRAGEQLYRLDGGKLLPTAFLGGSVKGLYPCDGASGLE